MRMSMNMIIYNMIWMSHSISKLAITRLEPRLWSYSENMKVLNIYSLVIRGHSNDTKNFVSLYVGVQMTNKSGWKYGEVPVTILWTLTKP